MTMHQTNWTLESERQTDRICVVYNWMRCVGGIGQFFFINSSYWSEIFLSPWFAGASMLLLYLIGLLEIQPIIGADGNRRNRVKSILLSGITPTISRNTLSSKPTSLLQMTTMQMLCQLSWKQKEITKKNEARDKGQTIGK